MTDIETEIQAKGLTAPRVTPADIEANIASEHYFTAAQGALSPGACENVAGGFPERLLTSDDSEVAVLIPDPLKLLTFCVLVLRNGFTVTGESACASPENFDAELGRKIARQNAVTKIWSLMGYELRSKLAKSDDDILVDEVLSGTKAATAVASHLIAMGAAACEIPVTVDGKDFTVTAKHN